MRGFYSHENRGSRLAPTPPPTPQKKEIGELIVQCKHLEDFPKIKVKGGEREEAAKQKLVGAARDRVMSSVTRARLNAAG